MQIDVYFYTDIKSIRATDGTIYAALSAKTDKKEYWVPCRESVKMNARAAAISALHSVIAGDEHNVKPYADSRIIIHSTSPYVTSGLFMLKKWASGGWKNSKGADIAMKDEWQEINCNLQGNQFEVIDEKPDSEALKRLLETD